MDEMFVPNLLRRELDSREEQMVKVTYEINRIRDKFSEWDMKPGTTDYYWLRKELEVYEKARRELRGEVSALRQAIAKLERED